MGWELVLLGLALHIVQPNQPVSDETAFATSPEGKSLITVSSEDWGGTSFKAGTEPETARAAARMTTASYAGEAGAAG